MTDKQFDELMRDTLGEYTEEAPDVWAGVASGIASRRRRIIFRRVTIAAAAAAACICAGLFLWDGGSETTSVQEPQSAPLAVVPPDSGDVPLLADAPVRVESHTDAGRMVPVEEPVASVPEAAEEEHISEEPEEDPFVSGPSDSQTSVFRQQKRKSVGTGTSYTLSDEFPEDYSETETKGRASQIAILTNISSFGGNGGASSSGRMLFAAGGYDRYSNSETGTMEISGSRHFYMPLTFGILFKTRLAGDFYVGAGITYSYLSSRYDALIDKVFYEGVFNAQHYLGIPVTFYYNFIDSGNWGVYATAGGALEKGLGQNYVFGGRTVSESIDGVQWSANVGIGVEYWFAPAFGIYLDPSLAYYFKCNQPVSIRTQQPFQPKIDLGFRFRF